MELNYRGKAFINPVAMANYILECDKQDKAKIEKERQEKLKAEKDTRHSEVIEAYNNYSKVSNEAIKKYKKLRDEYFKDYPEDLDFAESTDELRRFVNSAFGIGY